MAKDSSKEGKAETDAPAPEVLKPQSDRAMPSAVIATHAAHAKAATHAHRGTYRPSHKATFIGVTVVAAILLINALVIVFVMRGQEKVNAEVGQDEVTLTPAVLDTLGVSRTPVGDLGTELIVGPNSRFNGKVTVGSDVTIGGQLQLNSKFSASEASLTKLEAGDTSLQQLNVNGDSTISTLNLRRDLTVVGTTRLQGPVTVSQLLTVNNSMSVAGNLAVGGVLSARGFQASSLTSDTTLTIGGHIITRGSPPRVSAGGALGSNGTVSISGSDVAGTIAVNMGVGGGNGIVANVTFQRQYSSTPRVVASGGGRGMGGVYVIRNSGGFSIGIDNSVSPGGYTVDYIVMQ
jgi:cytoskeletal protein CcmA (bactofilin family)